MENEYLKRFTYIAIVTMMLGGLSATTASASYPILQLDIGRGHDPAEIQAGWTAFAVGDSGTVVDGIKVEIEPTRAGEAIQSRWRGGPTGIPYEQLYRDFIFTVNGGIRVTLSGLNPSETYEITLYSWDQSSAETHVADWLANGGYCLTTNFTGGGPTVAAEDSYAFSGNATADGSGRMVLEATSSPLTSHADQYFCFLNAVEVSSLQPLTTARHPVPANGSTITATAVTLEWEGGTLSTSSNVYFGESFDEVSNATPADTDVFRGNTVKLSFPVGSAGNPYPAGLAANQTYWWRIDEVNDLRPDSPWKGAVWSFNVASQSATEPAPMDASLFADPNAVPTWTVGAGAVRHHVYFGSSLKDVQAGTGGTDKGEVTEASYATGMLERNQTFYWRVDEIDATTTHAGEVWSFTTSRPGMGTVTMDFWEDVAGDHQLFNLLEDPRYPDSPTRSEALTEFGTVDGVGDGYGAQISGWLYCPVTGEYTFWLSCAGQGELWLSTNDDPANIVLLASEATWGTYDSFSIKSVPISLVAGQKYYIMARWKDFNAWDHCQVAWQGAGIPAQRVITGNFLSPFEPATAYGASPAKGATDIELTRILRWKPGQLAAEHRVYFGTDPNAVRDADTSSPEYKGTQPVGSETFDPGPLELETSYFWRVDEVNSVNPQSPWVGEVWSFRTGKFLVVDDFESYNDLDPDEEGSNRIYNTWIDGWGTETNGATVGYPNPGPGEHFAETTIVHGGKQAMPFFYDNNLKYSEGVRSIPAAEQDWTREGMGILSLWFRGYPASTGSFVEAPVGTYTMTASGTDITGTADEFHYAYKKLTGAGSITAKVLSVSNTDPWAKAGVMIRETLDPNSRHALACVTPGNGVAFEGRIYTADTSFSLNETQLTAPQWVKLERNAAGEFSVTRSDDGITWVPLTNVPSQVITMDAPTIYIGLAVTAHNATATCEAVFSNVTMTGSVSNEDWMDQDIGILSNTPEPLYVALNDTAVVYHEDPNALLLGQWTEWRIDLKAFADQGVDLTSIDSMAIGVGTKGDISTAGGSGTLYLDDIRLYRP
jgi:hypothetical protein